VNLDDGWIDDLEAETFRLLGEAATWDSPADLAVALDDAYRVRAHLRYLSDRLAQAVKDVEAGQSRYILVSMPPRLGKSHLTAVNFPAWCLHKHPDWEIMLLSHAPDLASGWGRQVRRLVEENPQLGLRIADDAGAVTDWQVVGQDGTRGGGVLSKSIRQSVTGRGAKVMILDDVVKDFADAHSESSREYVWNWWTANSRTRLHPPSLVVVIGTRWHEDDVIGRLRSDEYEGDPAQWEVISFPALAEDPEDTDPVTKAPFGPDPLGRKAGEPLLSPIVDETPEEALARWADIRRSVGTYAWSSLFQQSPQPSKGGIFNNDWWRFWRPGDLDEVEWDRLLTTWDCSFKKTDDSDFVVGQLWGAAGPDRYLLHQVRARMSFTDTLTAMRAFISEAPAHTGGQAVYEHVVEDKANGSAVIDVMRTEVEGVVPWSPGQDSKEARARAVSPTVESHNVYLPALAPWLPDYLGEMRAFPNGKNDDQVDGTSMALLRLRGQGNVVALVPGGRVNRPRPGAGPPPVRRALRGAPAAGLGRRV
jgi:predicted phage terminase large subunit-like protein